MMSLVRVQLGELYNADVAQLAEQLICNQQVIGSSPIIGFLWEIQFESPIFKRNPFLGVRTCSSVG